MELYKTEGSQYTVIICSFYGASARVRQKFANLWVARGCSVATMGHGTPDPKSAAIYPDTRSALKARAKSLLDTLIANGLDQQQIIFHLISEGGMRSWLHIMDYINYSSQVRSYFCFDMISVKIYLYMFAFLLLLFIVPCLRLAKSANRSAHHVGPNSCYYHVCLVF